MRGEVVKAFVVAVPAAEATPELAEDLREHVRTRLAPYAVPREIEFVAELPMTPTGTVHTQLRRDREAAKATASGPPKA